MLALATLVAGAPIIGGTSTTAGDYPNVVAILVGTHICSGTLVTPEWVMTAAHCVLPSELDQPDQAAVTRTIRVYVGTVSLPQGDGRVFAASETIPHPLFSPAAYGTHDVGLVHLAKPVTDITPSVLDHAVQSTNIVVTQVGFGATLPNAGGTTGVEYAIAGRMATPCAPYASHGASDDHVLCFDQTDGKGICNGDSGGPSFDDQHAVVAMTSFGDDACTMFSAHTRISDELDFLEQHVFALATCTTDDDCHLGRTCFVAANQCITPGALGTTCATNADCETGSCIAVSGDAAMRCSMACAPDGTCPAGFDCLSGTSCWPSATGGGCAVGGDPALGLALLALCRYFARVAK